MVRGREALPYVQDDEFCQQVAKAFDAILIRVEIDKPKKTET
jgi:hypothetical protein